jgi:hypothetical protein
MARHPKCDEKTVAKYLEAIRLGGSRKDAALYAGIAVRTAQVWIQKGREDKARKPYREFVRRLERAESLTKLRLTGAVHKAANDGDWKAAAWWLERRAPDEFGRTDTRKVELTATVNSEVAVEDLSDEDIIALLKQRGDL